jgi:putative ATPase
MADLFSEQENQARGSVAPLAVRMRPRTLDEFVGQEALVGPGKLLRRLIEGDTLTSVVFYGPPGTGKTTLARLIAEHTQAAWVTLHAAEAGVKDVRQVLESAKARLGARNQRTVLFLDEIHRFNRAQQDVLLRDVEEGVIVLIGATTENPFFAVNSPLLSRSRVFRFEPLDAAALNRLIDRALHDAERGLGQLTVELDDEARDLIIRRAAGDGRHALATLETAVLSERAQEEPIRVTKAVIAECLQRTVTPYDATGDEHYDIASAFIKSMRGSDPDATLYWLARMIEGGEDPRFIARRIAILASEDVGNADPQALQVAAAALQVIELIGMPEGQLTLSQAALYMALAPKSNSATMAIAAARKDVRENPPLPVPVHLRDAHYAGGRKMGHGADYQYPHDFPGGYVPQDYLGARRKYYNPATTGAEGGLVARWRERLAGGNHPTSNPDAD